MVGDRELHIGMEDGFERLEFRDPLKFRDPFGNRVEMIQAIFVTGK